ncbi:MAG: 5'-deoxynucleotidase, partial [Clostridia bacterium]|nr:5'-deoxynucleotidase [Clostridia bacterium]
SEEYKIMKAADRLAAYVKCLSELRSSNGEFVKAKKSIEEDLRGRNMPEVNYFLEHFEQSFALTLDELESF